MKIVKSKLSISLMSIGFIGVVAGISYAALYKPVVATPKMANKPTKSIVTLAPVAKVAPHQSEIEKYLDSMKGYLQTPPRDGIFGGDRIPTLHGKESDEIPSYKEIKALEGKVRMNSIIVGTYTDVEAKQELEDAENDESNTKEQLTAEDKVRLTYVHFITPNREDSEAANKSWEGEKKAIQAFGAELRRTNPETISKAVTVNGRPSWFIGRAIHASVNSCYKCHTNIKKGEPIGYAVALVSDAKH